MFEIHIGCVLVRNRGAISGFHLLKSLIRLNKELAIRIALRTDDNIETVQWNRLRSNFVLIEFVLILLYVFFFRVLYQYPFFLFVCCFCLCSQSATSRRN